MNAISASLTDSATMLRRNLRHTTRNPLALFNAVIMPIVLMFLMVYVLGDAFSVGVNYADYATPGLIMTTICYGISPTAIAVNSDMTTGFINRLRVMRISRAAVLNAHVIVTMLRSLVAITVIIGVALLMGFRPEASFLQWLGVIGIIALTVLAIGWLTVAFGLAAKTPETAGLAAVPLMLLPFLSSAFVPADKMGPGARQFAEYQPFTSIIETLRGL
ncbi:ABC transporter permease, partial [Planotetraspora phitsanulokensis]|uniref:ABC transporter permease n=1 Tax=Planotetraspora phitsanulokensis TaxID=575192 RepID=UPI0019527BE4